MRRFRQTRQHPGSLVPGCCHLTVTSGQFLQKGNCQYDKSCHSILYARVNFCRPYAGRMSERCVSRPRG